MSQADLAADPPSNRIPLRVLLVEDCGPDAELVLAELRHGGYEPTWERVHTAMGLRSALAHQPWDVITCDWVMPQFNAPAALAILRESGVDVPIIVVSGQVGEEYAVTAMKAGAHDFISKGNLARLCPAIEREAKETEVRRARRRVEEALRESEARYRSVIENAYDLIAEVSGKGQFLYASPGFRDALGYESSELLGTPWLGLIHPDDRALAAAMQTASAANAVFRFRHKRQDWRWFEGTSKEFWTTGGERRGVIIARDITERRRVEDALRESEGRYRDLVENSEDLICTHDLEGRILFVNARPARDLGYEQSELLKRRIQDILAPEARERFAGYLTTIRRYGVAKGLMTVQTKTGERRVWEYRNTLRMGVAAPVVRGMAHDVTERLRAEAALRQSEERLRLAQQAAHVTTWEWSVRSGKISWSGSLETELGLASGAFEGSYEAVLALVHPEDRALICQLVDRIVSGGIEADYDIEFRFVRTDGTVRWTAARGHIFRDQHGKPVRILGVDLDISERKRAEAVLRLSEQRFRALVENSLDLFSILDGDGTIRYASRSQQRVSGFSPEEFVGKPLAAFVHPDDLPRVGQLLAEVVHTHGRPVSAAYRLRHKDGSWHMVESAGINLCGDPVVAGILVQTRAVREHPTIG